MSEPKDISAMSPEELQSAVQSILANPAFAKLAAEVSGESAPSQPQNEPQKTPASAPAMPQITPEMLARLPQMMSAMAPLLSGMQGKGHGGKGEAEEKKGGDAERRRRLLAALKPYLSHQRKDAIDSILKVTEMTDLLGQLGGKSAPNDGDPK